MFIAPLRSKCASNRVSLIQRTRTATATSSRSRCDLPDGSARFTARALERSEQGVSLALRGLKSRPKFANIPKSRVRGGHRRVWRAIVARAPHTVLSCALSLAVGLALDRWYGFLPGLGARCGGAATLLGQLQWHWFYMPATMLSMVAAGPICHLMQLISMPSDQRSARTRDVRAWLSLAGHQIGMLAGMSCTLHVGPRIGELLFVPWTGMTAIGSMVVGMLAGDLFAIAMMGPLAISSSNTR